MSATLTITGRLTADPQLRYTPAGDAVASFCVAHTDRKLDRNTNQWVDAGDPLFINVSAFKQLAEGAAEMVKGDMVTVVGKLKADNYEKDGVSRKGVKLLADEIGRSVRARKGAARPAQEPAW